MKKSNQINTILEILESHLEGTTGDIKIEHIKAIESEFKENSIKVINSLLNELSEEDRIKVFSRYCTDCGSEYNFYSINRCSCQIDE